ncbi:MAG: DUF3467 domain-containing protein [Elusimicrobiota bacterium]
MEPKKFIKGKHQRTDWGHGVKEFRKQGEPEPPPKPVPEIEVVVEESVGQGKYANLASIGHTDGEFILDFMFLHPGTPGAKVHTRIISSPKHAKRFMAALADNIRRYEAKFGPIGPEPKND